MTDEQEAKFVEWLNKNVRHHFCIRCDASTVNHLREIVADNIFRDGAATLRFRLVVQTICPTCGHIEFFDAKTIGLV